MPDSVDSLTAQTIRALAGLAEVATPVTEEWQYVTDLEAAWAARLTSVGRSRAGEPADALVVAAVERAIAEAGLVTDPHRAIDWLSTLPQIVLVALAEPG